MFSKINLSVPRTQSCCLITKAQHHISMLRHISMPAATCPGSPQDQRPAEGCLARCTLLQPPELGLVGLFPFLLLYRDQ